MAVTFWRRALASIAAIIVLLAGPADAMLDNRKTPEPGRPMRLVRVPFAAVPGWTADDHRKALPALAEACRSGQVKGGTRLGGLRTRIKTGLEEACRALAALGPLNAVARPTAKRYFEQQFAAHRVETDTPAGFLTGYYVPELEGSLSRQGPYTVPVLGRPDDLVDLVDPALRASANDRISAARRKADGSLMPYFNRAEIEDGALSGRSLELLYLRDPVDLFFMQVQGSGRIRLPGGEIIKLGYAGKSGHPYTSIGGVLVTDGVYSKDEMSLAVLRSYLEAEPARGRKLMQRNQSYVFFKRQPGPISQGPIGASGAPLTTGRSLAVDTAYHMLGVPIFVVSDDLKHHGEVGFRRLMIAQDVGSAIKGPVRGDIFWGMGAGAEQIAGETKHAGRFFVLLPRSAARGAP